MIVVTGTPGAGKTAVAELLAKRLGLELIKANELIKRPGFHHGRQGGAVIADLPKLTRTLRGFDGIVEGHVLSDIELPATAIVLRASPRSIRRRLSPRRYTKAKLEENIEAEALDYCAIHAMENYKRVIQVDTTGLTPAQSAVKALRYLRSGKSDKVDWSGYFLR